MVYLNKMIKLTFKPESEQFILATKEYSEIWEKEGAKIITAFEIITGLKFQQKEIEVIIYEGVSFSGSLVEPMKLRASSSVEDKKGTLIHELGHRLIAPLHNRLPELDEHQTLDLYLYDVWEYLYGKEFADKMVQLESKRKGRYDYNGTWKWALNLNKEKRRDLLQKMRILNGII